MAQIGIIGGGPAGLMAAETLSAQGHAVKVFEAMPTVGRKFLMAGKSGLNITHAEPHETLLSRFGAATPALQPALDGFTNEQIRDWCTGLGIETFVGSSGRVFPVAMKASPLLRAWLARLAGQGVSIHPRHHWRGFAEDGLAFDTPQGPQTLQFDAVVLALGGASWPKLGSDAAWVPFLADRGVGITPFAPANCGYERDWSPIFVERFAGAAVKSVVASSVAGAVPGEFVITQWGVEGSLIYAHAAALREALARDGEASLTLDLAPQRSVERLASDLARQPAKLSFTNRLRKATGIEGVKAGLLRECAPDVASLSPEALAARFKALELPLLRPRPIAEAISSAGGIAWPSVDEHLMLKSVPGVFVAGEMLDWEAPTGGYLLTACLATGRAAAEGVAAYLSR